MIVNFTPIKNGENPKNKGVSQKIKTSKRKPCLKAKTKKRIQIPCKTTSSGSEKSVTLSFKYAINGRSVNGLKSHILTFSSRLRGRLEGAHILHSKALEYNLFLNQHFDDARYDGGDNPPSQQFPSRRQVARQRHSTSEFETMYND